MSKTPKQRLHNPEGGGYKPAQQIHKLKSEKESNDPYEKILRKKKVSLRDLRDIIDLDYEQF